MKKKHILWSIGILMMSMLVFANAQANEEDVNIPITADQAFDAYANQLDPKTGEPATVVIVDVRTTAEYFWVGTAAQVNKIVTVSGEELTPYIGKVNMRLGSRFLEFEVENGHELRTAFLQVSQVESIDTTRIAYHVPYKIWDEASCSLIDNPHFADQMAEIAEKGIDTVILMCRSGKRSNTRAFDTALFNAVYEIDQPDGTDGRGGFEGTTYHDVYLGYRGFPGRDTSAQESPSVSWSDTGLPIHIGWCPLWE